MAPPPRRTSPLLLALALILASCTDAPPTAPVVDPEPARLLGGIDDLLKKLLHPVEVVQRDVPLAQDEVVGAVVGSGGGTIVLPNAGLTVVIPAGALNKPTAITVTAPAGDLVGFEFAPHGLKFKKDVQLLVSLEGTEAAGQTDLLSSLTGVYYGGVLEELLQPLELLDLDLLGDSDAPVVRMDIRHFSGYAVGRSKWAMATD